MDNKSATLSQVLVRPFIKLGLSQKDDSAGQGAKTPTKAIAKVPSAVSRRVSRLSESMRSAREIENTEGVLGLYMYPLPEESKTNVGADPFLLKFADSCRGSGVNVYPVPRGHSKSRSISYVHWPHCWGKVSTLKYSMGVGRAYASSLKNNKTIWDIHDLVDHQTRKNTTRSTLFRYYSKLYHEAEEVVVHERSAIDPLSQLFGERAIAPLVARFGSWDVFHGPRISKNQARKNLDLPKTAQIFLLFGSDRENRRHELITQAFSAYSNGDQILCVAGGNTGRQQGSLVNGHNRIIRFGNLLDDDKVRDLFCSADFVIEHGKNQLTSGVVRAAMSYGKPVISRDFGCTSDMARGAAVWIKDDSLQEIFQETASIPDANYESLVRHADERNRERSWEAFGDAIASSVRRLQHTPVG
jgi:glycosyltransferase involved in cell wall biosynthesis